MRYYIEKEIKLSKDPEDLLKFLQFEEDLAETEVSECRNSINNGNWKGYDENLKLRKEALKRYIEELDWIKEQISIVKNN